MTKNKSIETVKKILQKLHNLLTNINSKLCALKFNIKKFRIPTFSPSLFRALGNTLKRILKSKILWQFIATVIATMLGVFAAFRLNTNYLQEQRNKITAQKLHSVFLESQYNSTIAKNAYNNFFQKTDPCIFIKPTDSSLALAATQDENIYSFLPAYKISLLISYVEAQKTLNNSLNNYKDYLLGMRKKTENKNKLIENAKGNAASAATMCFVLQRELKIYFDNEIYDHKKIISLKKEIKNIKKKIISGEIGINLKK